jgi:hypothetical protein
LFQVCGIFAVLTVFINKLLILNIKIDLILISCLSILGPGTIKEWGWCNWRAATGGQQREYKPRRKNIRERTDVYSDRTDAQSGDPEISSGLRSDGAWHPGHHRP